MSVSIVGWTFHYLLKVMKYKLSHVQTPMEPFDTDAALLSEHTTFDVKTLKVTAEFADNETFFKR